MYRIVKHDVSRHFARPFPRLIAQVAFGLGCSLLMLLFLTVVQLWVPLPGPFAFVFPAVVIATLYGRWVAGVTALVACLVGISYVILPHSIPITFMSSNPISRVLTSGGIGIVLLILAETFRSSVATHAAGRDREIERHEVLLRELEHRTRNNFALVASLLEFQRRQSSSPEVIHALDQAIRRVHTFADAYSQLDVSKAEHHEVEMKPYLSRLLDRVSDALFSDDVRIESDIAGIAMPSRKAVAVGLYVNEALTNCAKYAFPEGGGMVRVALGEDADGRWRLTVLDDGIGDARLRPSADDVSGGGLGGVLFEALATQAGAQHRVTLPEKGRRLDLVSVG